MAVSINKLATLKAKFRAFKTGKNEIETPKIASIRFCFYGYLRLAKIMFQNKSESDRYFENITFASLKSPKKSKSAASLRVFISFSSVFKALNSAFSFAVHKPIRPI